MTKEQLAEQKYPIVESTGSQHWTRMDTNEKERLAYIAGFEAAEQKWVSIQDNKPTTYIPVMVSCEKEYDGRTYRFCTISVYVPYLTVLEEDFMGEDFWEQGDYDKATGHYYTPEGWYEWQSEPDVNYKISATVTHWMPLPKLPNND